MNVQSIKYDFVCKIKVCFTKEDAYHFSCFKLIVQNLCKTLLKKEKGKGTKPLSKPPKFSLYKQLSLSGCIKNPAVLWRVRMAPQRVRVRTPQWVDDPLTTQFRDAMVLRGTDPFGISTRRIKERRPPAFSEYWGQSLRFWHSCQWGALI